MSQGQTAVARRGFTLVEAMACLLVLSLGFAAAIGLVAFGLQLARQAQARALGLATALTVAADPAPLLPAGGTLAVSGGTAKGWVNGLWVERDEGPGEAVAPGLTSHLVRVEVFEGTRSRAVCSYQERVLRRGP